MSSSLSGSDNQNAETRRAGRLSVREKNFELMDSLYKAAVEGHTDQFRAHATMLDQILTPNENTILHIHITARPNQTMKSNNKLKSSLWRMMSTFKKQSSSSEHFGRDILEMCPGLLLKTNTKGETLLHIAARHGHADVVKDLIAECKKPHQNDPEKGVEAVRLMQGMTNEAKDTALHEAARYNQIDVVKMLTKEDPSLPYDANNAGETPLYVAAERGYKDVTQDILLTCKSPADHGPMGRTALHAAAFRNDTEMTKVLLDSSIGTQTSKADQQGWLPLHLAAHLGYYNVVKELLKADKSAAYKADNEGKIPLHLAAGKGRLNTVQELIMSCPSSCELVDDRGWNVFHFALQSGSRRTIELLLKSPSLGNLVNEKNDDGNTPLLEHAGSGSLIPSFVCHPKVDRLAFNQNNCSAEDIIRSDKLLFRPNEKNFMWCLNRLNRFRCRRHIVFGNGERKEQFSNTSIEDKKNNYRKEKSSSIHEELTQYVNKGKESQLVVAALIATVTFTAGITMPGGYINEIGPDQGAAVLTKSSSFQAFVIFNSVAMILSTIAVFIHLKLSLLGDKVFEFNLWKISRGMTKLALFFMVFAFLTGTYSVLPSAKILAVIVSIITGGSILYIYAYDYAALFSLIKAVMRFHVNRLQEIRKEFQLIYFLYLNDFVRAC
ncbi:ankyrin repeat-containing protein NPR4-like [Citrus sinensis]|uniref:PGG domain-containing protein n=1 Tax=Citrus sinensis TaxID=2711 RepID=A0A067DC58_CITSI|nr:ankyrin repeat-containing protein NPR4-like [Citrus sinensis]KDO40433.1 hypothetical protein CISIN_1g006054mg [Citrus sinensis]